MPDPVTIGVAVAVTVTSIVGFINGFIVSVNGTIHGIRSCMDEQDVIVPTAVAAATAATALEQGSSISNAADISANAAKSAINNQTGGARRKVGGSMSNLEILFSKETIEAILKIIAENPDKEYTEEEIQALIKTTPELNEIVDKLSETCPLPSRGGMRYKSRRKSRKSRKSRK